MPKESSYHYFINLSAFPTILKRYWWIVTLFSICALAGGVLSALLSPRLYSASTSFVAEGIGSGRSELSDLASQLGVDVNLGNSNDAIYPELYDYIIKSHRFLAVLSTKQVHTSNGAQTSIGDYILSIQKHTLGEKIYYLTKGKDISDRQKKLIDIENGIVKRIGCTVDRKTNIAQILVTTEDALASAEITQAIYTQLKQFIVNYRRQKDLDYYTYSLKGYKEERRKFDLLSDRYNKFCDNNNNPQSGSLIARQEELEDNMQIQYNISQQYFNQLKMAKQQLMAKLPVFTIIEPVCAPVKPNNSRIKAVIVDFVKYEFILILVFLISMRKSLVMRERQVKQINNVGQTWSLNSFLYQKRCIFFIVAILSIILSILIILMRTTTYTSTIRMVDERKRPDIAIGLNKTMAFLNSNLPKNNSIDNPSVYAKIIYAPAFINKLAHTRITHDKTYKDYIQQSGQTNWFNAIKDRINCKVERSYYLVSISFRDKSPKVAEIMTNAISQELQRQISALRFQINKADEKNAINAINHYRKAYKKAEMQYAHYISNQADASLPSVKERISQLKKDRNEALASYQDAIITHQRKVANLNRPIKDFAIVSEASIPSFPDISPILGWLTAVPIIALFITLWTILFIEKYRQQNILNNN